mmetsp:Transcript_27305/g.37669  ORF Transcript_27305/g.37669 Transcript_27305/m.37669 type:complete len:368 (+) Transcript_27305:338-1441(+)
MSCVFFLSHVISFLKILMFSPNGLVLLLSFELLLIWPNKFILVVTGTPENRECEELGSVEQMESNTCGCSGVSRKGTDEIYHQYDELVTTTSQKSEPSLLRGGRLVAIEGGWFQMGTDNWPYSDDMEGPSKKVYVESFEMDETEVTNEAFAEFVAATGYTTDAEKYGWSFVYEPLLSREVASFILEAVDGSEWWLPVPGACWYAPEGPNSPPPRGHPAVHLSWADSRAFCLWADKRLPSEAEWEFAARGGAETAFPWGNSEERLHEQANTFDGYDFPFAPTELKDRYLSTAPARSFPPNGFGLFHTVGNVWEWVADKWSNHPDETQYSQRGGSYMCHKSYCYRYRVTSRTKNTADSSAGHMGARCAR